MYLKNYWPVPYVDIRVNCSNNFSFYYILQGNGNYKYLNKFQKVGVVIIQ